MRTSGISLVKPLALGALEDSWTVSAKYRTAPDRPSSAGYSARTTKKPVTPEGAAGGMTLEKVVPYFVAARFKSSRPSGGTRPRLSNGRCYGLLSSIRSQSDFRLILHAQGSEATSWRRWRLKEQRGENA